MAYPTTRPLKIKINGVDRTASISSIPDEIGSLGIRIEDRLDMSSRCYFTVKNAAGMSLDERQEVVVSDTGESTNYFGGYIIKLDGRERGPFVDYDVIVEDYSFLLKNPQQYINRTYTNYTDRAIIRHALNQGAPDIDTTTYVEQLQSGGIDYIRFDHRTPFEVLEEIKRVTGGMWYVDYDKKLHYFDAATNAAPYAISDVVADPPVGPYPCDNLQKVLEVPEADRVLVQARQGWATVRFSATSQDTEQGNLAYENVGAGTDGFEDDGQDFSDWEAAAGNLITDGEFDNWTGGDLDSWTKDNAEDGEEVGDPGSGSSSAEVTASAANGGIYQGAITVVPGTKYRLMFMYKNTAGDTAQFRVYDETNGADITAYSDLADSTVWANFTTHYFTAPALCVAVRIYLAGKANGDVVYFDDVTLRTEAGYLIVIENSELGATWAYMGDAYGGNAKVYAYNDLYLSDPGFNGQYPGSMTPTSYHIYPARGDKGNWVTAKLTDNNLVTTTQTDERGDQFLTGVSASTGYTCTVKEPGLRSGMNIDVTNARYSLSADSFMIKSVTTQWTSGGYLEADLELGVHAPLVSDVLSHARNIWDEGQFLPLHPGDIEMISGNLDSRTYITLDTYNDQTGYPSCIAFRKSHTDTLETLTDTIDTEELGLIEFKGVDTTQAFDYGAYIKASQVGAAGVQLATKIEIVTYSSTAANDPITISEAGNLEIHGQQELRFYDNGNYVGFKAPALAADQIWVLPDADGNANEFLQTDGTGNLQWAGGAGGGTDLTGLGTDDTIARWDGTDTLQDSGVTLDDSDNIVTPGTIELDFASGDPIIIFDTQGADKWTIGVDDSDSDKLKINVGGSLDTYSFLELDDTNTNKTLEMIAGGATGEYPEVVLSSYTDSDHEARITFHKSHDDTIGTKTATTNLEDLGRIRFQGVDTNGAWRTAAEIDAMQGANAGAAGVPGNIALRVFDNAESETAYVELDGENGDIDIDCDRYIYITADSGIYVYDDVQIQADLDITGALSKGSGSFKIDHPLDPLNRWLYHSFVESPDMMNVYNGNVTLDERGSAVVELPDYFMALNRDYRYQLTPIGGAMPDLHIGAAVASNEFGIAGGQPFGTVSWQITGVRQDAWALEHPVVVEVDKAEEERGILRTGKEQRRLQHA